MAKSRALEARVRRWRKRPVVRRRLNSGYVWVVTRMGEGVRDVLTPEEVSAAHFKATELNMREAEPVDVSSSLKSAGS